MSPGCGHLLPRRGHASNKVPIRGSNTLRLFDPCDFLCVFAMEMGFIMDYLKPPWNQKFKSVLVDSHVNPCQWAFGDLVAGFGVAGSSMGSDVEFECGIFHPGSGLSFDHHPIRATLSFESCDDAKILPDGVIFGFEDVKVASTGPFKLQTNGISKIWYIPAFDKELPFTVCHQYAGAFDGWGRAIDWLQENQKINISRSIAVDADYDVMHVWSLRTSANFWTKKVPMWHNDTEKVTGVVTCIQDHTWFNLCRAQSNMFFTLSPPCQPWSLGGRGLGVECTNGMSFIDSIGTIKMVRPLFVLFEGADSTPSHKRFRLVRAGMNYVGYKQCWSNISHYHELSMMNRSRWLAVWIRSDIPFHTVGASLGLFDGTKCAWDDDKYSFHIPSQIDHQLFLSHQLVETYGDFKWLPKSKSLGLSVLSSQDEVLSARCIRSSDCLPTLCASYSQQHELASAHIEAKGIFAALVKKQGKYAFIDPMRFVPLFGMRMSQTAILPIKIDMCFHHLGNAITVPHALLAFLVGFNAIGITSLPMIQTVLQCWNERAFSHRMIIARSGDFVLILPCRKATDWIPKCISTNGLGELKLTLNGGCGCVQCSPLDSIAAVVSMFGFQCPQQQDLICTSDFKKVCWDSNVGDFQGCIITISKGTWFCFSFTIPIEPTQDFLVQIACQEDNNDSKHPAFVQSNPVVCDSETNEESLALHPLPSDLGKAIANPVEHEANSIKGAKCAVLLAGLDDIKEVSLPADADDSIISHELQKAFLREASQTEANWVECKSLSLSGFDRVFLVELKGDSSIDSALVVSTMNSCNPVCSAVSRFQPPINFVVRRNMCAISMTINGHFADPFLMTSFHDGDVIDLRIETSNTSEMHHEIKQRINLFVASGVKAASDEISFALDLLKVANQEIHFAPIADIRTRGGNPSFSKLQQAFSGIGHLVMYHVDAAVLPIFIHDHWCAIEISKVGNCVSVTSVGVPQQFDAPFRKIAADALSFPLVTIKHFTMPLPSFEGLCGWVLLRRWFNRHAPELNEHLSKVIANWDVACLFPGCQEGSVTDIVCPISARVLDFARILRGAFLTSFVCPPTTRDFWPASILTGGMEVDSQLVTAPSKGEDPWKSFDPWMQKSGQKQAKWEDLRLPSDHPFVNQEGQLIKQVHKQKLSINTGGIAFATKSSLVELMKIDAVDPVAILIPNGDKKVSNSIHPQPEVSGPFEVVVEDPVSGLIYKRQVLLVQTKAKVRYQLAKPTYTATLPELKELVLEIDSRLASRELCNHLSEKPLDAFRAKAADQYPPNTFQGVKMYAYRKFTPSGSDSSHVVHQVMCKLSNEKRIIAIERSGLGNITCRDFLAKGETTSDLTVIPRFWAIDKSSKDEAIRAVTGIDGFAGLIISRRGIAARSWTSKIADLRKALLSQDERISELNIGVVPRVLCNSTGWPISISPPELIKATYHAVKLGPVPMRCHRQLGVTCWQLAFEEDPKVTKFVVKFNAQLHEILLTPPEPSAAPKPSKKQGAIRSQHVQRRGAQVQQAQEPQEDPVAERVSILEAKFQNFEKRQEKVERQLETGFDSLQSQLRQVLHAVSGAREKSPTGETPPPKQAKHL